MSSNPVMDFEAIYENFASPISSFDCGEMCAPYNDLGVPFCCDITHAVPTVYNPEWDYLNSRTDLWGIWTPKYRDHYDDLRAKMPENQMLVACLGHIYCQRNYRAVSCRAFPFFPYIDQKSEFLGLSYYWEYEDRCWVISNLHIVSEQYRFEFITTYELILKQFPDEYESFRHYSRVMRRNFSRKRRAIPLLHRNGFCYKITPRKGCARRVPVEKMPKFGVYKITPELLFPDER